MGRRSGLLSDWRIERERGFGLDELGIANRNGTGPVGRLCTCTGRGELENERAERRSTRRGSVALDLDGGLRGRRKVLAEGRLRVILDVESCLYFFVVGVGVGEVGGSMAVVGRDVTKVGRRERERERERGKRERKEREEKERGKRERERKREKRGGKEEKERSMKSKKEGENERGGERPKEGDNKIGRRRKRRREGNGERGGKREGERKGEKQGERQR